MAKVRNLLQKGVILAKENEVIYAFYELVCRVS